MPIDIEQWRARTGLFYASRAPLPLPRYRHSRPDSASMLTRALLVLVLRISASSICALRRLLSCLSSLLSLLALVSTKIMRTVTRSPKTLKRIGGVIGLLALCLIVAQMLLIMAGDVEQNPGPETPAVEGSQHVASVSLNFPENKQPLSPHSISLPAQATAKITPTKSRKPSRKPCGVCPPCRIKEDCGECKHCKDMRKFGGERKLRQKCKKRQCNNMVPYGGNRSRTLDEFFFPVNPRSSTTSTTTQPPHPEGQSSKPGLAKPQIQAPHRSSKKCQTLLEKALEEGTINTYITKVLINGPPGVGKSSLIRLLLGELMAELRDSTGIMLGDRVYAQLIPTENIDEASYDRPIQSGMVHIDGEYKWNRLDTEQQELLLAELIARGEQQEEIGMDTQSCTSEEAPLQQPELSPESQAAGVQVTCGEATKKVLQNLENCTSHGSLDVHWICLIDTGGQPHFLEILQSFVRNTSVNLVVFKLSEKLDHQPKFEYYKKGERLPTRNNWIEVTNEQMIEQTARTLLSCMPKPLDPVDVTGFEPDSIPNKPKMMLVGTFKDKVEKCTETPLEKSEQLRANDHLKPVIDNDIVIASDDGTLVFQIDGSRKGWNSNKEVIDEIRQKIMKKTNCAVLKVPTRWYILQLELLRAAGKSQWKILSLADCIRIGEQSCKMTEEEVLAALNYFDELNILLYYPEVVRDLVFCDPQHLVKKVSDLIVASFPGSSRFFKDIQEGTRTKLHNKGTFTSDLLKLGCFDVQSDLFTVEKFISLLEHLNIIAEVEGPQPTYFMPCVLRRIRVDEHQRRSKWTMPNDRVDPLLIHFPSGWSPRGLFCALIVSLTSLSNTPRWTLTTNVGKFSPSRNLIEFEVGRKRGTVIIVDAMKWFEVHTSGIPEDCQEIRCMIYEKINEILTRLSYERSAVKPQDGFFCDEKKCKKKELHVAKVESDEKNRYYLTCTEGHRNWMDLTEKQRVWLPSDEGTNGPSPAKRPRLSLSSFYAKVSEKCEKIIDFLSVNVNPVVLATELQIIGLINSHVRELAELTTVPVSDRIRPVIKAVISKLELKEENAEKFKSVLQKLEVLEDVMQIID